VADDIVVAPAGIVTTTVGTVQDGAIGVDPPPVPTGVQVMFKSPEGVIVKAGAELHTGVLLTFTD
jgi:hypothetical protein